MNRHSDLSLRKPKACSLSRATAFNKHTVAAFFEKLKNVYGHNVEFANGTRLFNLDKTSASTVQKPRNVVTLKGQKQVSQVTSFKRGTLVTTCCLVNALGYSLPPVMIFPQVNFKQHMISIYWNFGLGKSFRLVTSLIGEYLYLSYEVLCILHK